MDNLALCENTDKTTKFLQNSRVSVTSLPVFNSSNVSTVLPCHASPSFSSGVDIFGLTTVTLQNHQKKEHFLGNKL